MTTTLSFSDCVEKIEAAYEFMLAYAAQGRDREPQNGASPDIREMLGELHAGLSGLGKGVELQLKSLHLNAWANTSLEALGIQAAEDAQRAIQVLDVVLTAPALSSQLVDNLNASAHLRCVLTDLFVLDEVLQQHSRATLATPAS